MAGKPNLLKMHCESIVFRIGSSLSSNMSRKRPAAAIDDGHVVLPRLTLESNCKTEVAFELALPQQKRQNS